MQSREPRLCPPKARTIPKGTTSQNALSYQEGLYKFSLASKSPPTEPVQYVLRALKNETFTHSTHVVLV